MDNNWQKIKDKWNRITDQEFEQVKKDKDKLVALIQQRYGQTRDIIEEQLKQLVPDDWGSKVQQVAQTVVDKSQELEHQLSDYAGQVSSSIKAYVKDKPLSSLCWGVVAGFILGKLTK